MLIVRPKPKTLAAERIGRSYLYPQTTDFILSILDYEVPNNVVQASLVVNVLSAAYHTYIFRSFVGKHKIFLNCPFEWYAESRQLYDTSLAERS